MWLPRFFRSRPDTPHSQRPRIRLSDEDRVIYAIGVPWLKAAVGVTWSQALSLGLTPFLVGDLLKAALAAGIFTLAWRWVDHRRSA